MKILLATLLLSFGCQTQFTGSPHIDPATCQAKCAGDRLVMAGMVYMGEYSSACLCEVPRAPVPGGPPSATPSAAGAAGGAAAGVVMQMRRENERQRQSQGRY